MNKVLCDICGTAYPENAERCPICGSSREYALDSSEYIPAQMPEYVRSSKNKAGVFSEANRKIEESGYETTPDHDVPMDVLAAEESRPNKPGMNIFAVIALTVLLVLLVVLCAFVFFRYYLPNAILPEKDVAEISASEPSQETQPLETEPVEIPCGGLVLTSGIPELKRIGQFWLLHVIAMPENTTDTVVFQSTDESVITVTQEGRICAVGEGQASVVISCGDEELICNVIVKIPDQAEQTQPETVPETEPSMPEEVPEESLPEETPETDGSKQLKLKQWDITFKKKGITFKLELDCDIPYEDITWLTMNPDVVICHDGVITVIGPGKTEIVAQYGDQQVRCIVRCNLN